MTGARMKWRLEWGGAAAGIKELNELAFLDHDSRNAPFQMRRRRSRSKIQGNVIAVDRQARGRTPPPPAGSRLFLGRHGRRLPHELSTTAPRQNTSVVVSVPSGNCLIDALCD
jgi:hypothetical protein